MMNINIKYARNCALCKYWYDPTNSALRPVAPRVDLWEYDNHARKMCLKKNLEMQSSALCTYFEKKMI